MNIESAYNETSLRQQLHLSGWTNAEEKLLSDAAEQSKLDGTPLRTVFAAVAKATGRQPNSVRNHYYLKMKTEAAGGRVHSGAFVPFTDEEVEMLMRTVLTAIAKGESVRSCTLRMGNGDNRAMLRYQNKYRSILKKNPELVEQIMKKLESEGIYTTDPYAKQREKAETARTARLTNANKHYSLNDGDVPHGDMVKSVAYAVESLARIDEFNAELLFRSLGVLAAKAANVEVRPAESAIELPVQNIDNDDVELEREKQLETMGRMYRMMKELVSLNYDFLNKNGINKMSHLSEYIKELSDRVNDCEQLMLEMRDDFGSLIG
ncbi:MAG: hypothetical protein J1E60_06475 [Christensenellaceae bacterium]|nr:hypothetical protein [Christensenellaceae bacterium]